MMDGDVFVFILLCLLVNPSNCSMTWTQLVDEQAVCNDYSRAGYFIERSPSRSTKWLIYLESGGLCYSPDTCNTRYLHPNLRREFATNKDDPSFLYNPQVNLTRAWEYSSRNRSLSSRINPLMTSMSTYILDDDSLATIEGRDFMDSSQKLNPIFYDFNRVIVPYCSSDMWLAEDDHVPNKVNLSSHDPQKQFLDRVYSPTARNLTFTFRGQTILKSVIKQLLNNTGLSNASEILLAGSSAGGLGVVNNAKWIISKLQNASVNASISILADSAWFINFRGNIFRRFDGTTQAASNSDNEEERTDERLLTLIDSIPQCVAVTSTGSPCCISLECVMSDEQYFPVGDIPVMLVTSIYDVFLLADAIAKLAPPGSTDVSTDLPSVGIQFITTVAEYGGVMNSSIKNTASTVPGMSYIATQCFQHVYFSPSTLTAPGGVLGDSSVIEISSTLGSFSGSFRHLIQDGVWNDYTFGSQDNTTMVNDADSLRSCDKSKVNTMRDAINMWYICRFQEPFEFRDTCFAPHCHDSCPEEIEFLQVTSDEYPTWSIIVIISIVVTITVLSLVLKCALYTWKKVLFMKQDEYLDQLVKDEENCLDGIPQFPVCGIEDAVSIACLDLQYSVVARRNKVKDERQDATTVSFAIAHHIDDEDEENQFVRGNERRSARSLRTVKSGSARVSTSHAAVLEEVDHPQSQVHFKDPELEESREDMFSGSTSPFIPNKKSYNIAHNTLKRQDALEKKDSSTSVTYSQLGQEGDVPLMEDGPMQSKKGLSYYVSCGKEMKHILKGVSIYFNPGELVGIMGPSGCGKTTFLDLLTGRRRVGHIKGEIFVNGIPLDRVRDEYLSFTGYVLQLASPFYEELTVRENIILAAHMKLPRKVTWREKFVRVEQVMDITGLTNVGDMTVGGAVGPGISGGQKKRLTIALQLLTMPKVIFLDEPTSGLDSTASVELLSHLNDLADSNRTVVVTIHQPRLEIFHMFHKLILLCDGKIAYHGVPQKAYGFFAEAAVNSFWSRNLIPEIGDHNPADIIMDMLGKPVLRRAILSHYQESTEPYLIKWAIKKARVKDFESMSIETLETITTTDLKRDSMTTTPYQIQLADFVKQDKAKFFNRLAVLETRADMRTSWIWRVYLPIIFFGYGFLLGTTYYQQDQPLLIMAGFCVYSVASALFMFPVMQNYFIKALEVYGFENADGAGRASDIVIQAFARFSTMAITPVVLCSAVLYVLLVNSRFWDITVLLKLIVVGMALNQTWIALLTFLLCALPSLAFRLSPIISSIAGFSSGFFIPREVVNWGYRWIFYINPNYYGFSASAYFLLSDINNECDNDTDVVECTIESGNYALKRFYFDQTRPYMNIAILLLMTFLYLALAVFSNWLRHTNFFLNLRAKMSCKKTFMDEDDTSLEGVEIEEEIEEDISHTASEETNVPLIDPTRSSTSMGDEETTSTYRDVPTSPPYGDDDVFDEMPSTPSVPPTAEADKKVNEQANDQAKERWIRFAKGTLDRKINDEERIEMETKLPGVDRKGRPDRLAIRNVKKRKRVQSIFLDNNQEHTVFKPSSSRKTPATPDSQFANLVVNLMAQKRSDSIQTPSPATGVGTSLKERKQHFEWSIKTTQEVVKETTEELKRADDTQKEKKTLRDLTRKVTQKIKDEKEPRMANIVEEVMKLASSAPTSFDGDEDDKQEDFRPRAQSTVTGTKVKRRQRRISSSSNVLLQKFMERAKKAKPTQSTNQPTKASSPLKKAASARFDLPQKPQASLIKRSTDINLSERKFSDHNNTPTPKEQKPSLKSPVYVLQLSEQLEDIQEISDDECEEHEPSVEVEVKPSEYRKLSSSSN